MSAPVEVGEVLAGKYRVERVLGTGGMGVIIAAHHLQLDQRVALKLLLPDAAKDEEVVARFAREARAAAKIQSEHVARVIDVGALESGAPFMVMEYLEGLDLEQTLRETEQLPIEQAVSYLLQACEAVAEAHALGIVHRDLKPANLFIADRADGSKSVKVLDFGISKMLSPVGTPDDASLTKTSAVMGSPMYMSPEQLRSSRDVDARSDIWALGVILYEMLAGRGPFASGTVPEVCASILKEAPPPLRELREEVPEGLEAVVLRCLEKDVKKRFGNIAQLCMELLSYGPPGSELSMERVSRVLQKASASSAKDLQKHLERVRASESATQPAVPRSMEEGVESLNPLVRGPIPSIPSMGSVPPGRASSPPAASERTPAPLGMKPISVAPPSASPSSAAGASPSTSSTEVAASASVTLMHLQRRPITPRKLALGGAGLVVLIGLVAVFAAGSGDKKAPASTGEGVTAGDAVRPPMLQQPVGEPGFQAPTTSPTPVETVATAKPIATATAAPTATAKPTSTAATTSAPTTAPTASSTSPTSPTTAPTSKATTSPTTSATAAPTTAPTVGATAAPTAAPATTSAPAPTTAASSGPKK